MFSLKNNLTTCGHQNRYLVDRIGLQQLANCSKISNLLWVLTSSIQQTIKYLTPNTIFLVDKTKRDKQLLHKNILKQMLDYLEEINVYLYLQTNIYIYAIRFKPLLKCCNIMYNPYYRSINININTNFHCL